MIKFETGKIYWMNDESSKEEILNHPLPFLPPEDCVISVGDRKFLRCKISLLAPVEASFQ